MQETNDHEDVIVVEGLQKTVRTGFWGKKKILLNGVSFSLRKGEILGFVGPNGAGKSTTIKHLIGGATPTAGSIQLRGRDPQEPATRRQLGYLPELPALPRTLTAREVLRMHAALAGVDDDDGNDTLLRRTGLTQNAQDRVGTFSKGMQTRLGLAVALVGDPAVLILDEPMSGLDPLGRKLVRELIREEQQRGRTILFSSHVLADVEALCDRVVIIDHGRLLFFGDVKAALGDEKPHFEVAVRTAGAPRPLMEAIGPVHVEGDRTMLTIQQEDPLEVAQKLKAAGAMVLELRSVAPRLEDRVVALIEAAARDDAAARRGDG